MKVATFPQDTPILIAKKSDKLNFTEFMTTKENSFLMEDGMPISILTDDCSEHNFYVPLTVNGKEQFFAQSIYLAFEKGDYVAVVSHDYVDLLV